MQAVRGFVFSILIVFPVLLPADCLCLNEREIINKLASLRANWNQFDKEKIRKSWGVEFEEVFCDEGAQVKRCDGLSFTKVDGNCGCGVTFYFDQSDKAENVNLVYTVPEWSKALHIARDFVMSLKPLSVVTGYRQSVEEGWDIPDTGQKYIRYFSWTGERSYQVGDTVVVEEMKSIQLSISECSPGKWRINLYVVRQE